MNKFKKEIIRSLIELLAMSFVAMVIIFLVFCPKAQAKQYNVTSYAKDAYIAGADCQHIYTYQNGKESYVNTVCVPKND